LDQRFNTRKGVIAVGALATLCLIVILAAIPQPPTWLAITLLCAISLAGSYGSVLLTHMRAHFPNHLAGRGATTGNIAQLAGAALLPIFTGLIPPLFGTVNGGYAPEAYRLMFAVLALALAVGLVIYLVWARDIRPHESV
jgi:MFS family permease